MESGKSKRYLLYLTIIAFFGWAMASFNFNLLTETLPLMEQSLHFGTVLAGLISGIVYLGMFTMVLIYGPLIDRLGRKLMFQIVLLVSAVFTGFTSLVTNFFQLIGLRFVADGSAFGELPTGLTLVTEESPSNLRGTLYGFIQGGWPIGVFIGSGIYLALVSKIGWRGLYVIGVLPLIVIIIGRIWIKESDRFTDMKSALNAKDKPKYKINIEKAKEFTYKQLFEHDLLRQTLSVNLAWIFYTLSFVTTNVVIAAIFVSYYNLTSSQAVTILLIASGIGFFAYPLAGWYGQKIGRREAWVLSSILMPFFALIFYFIAKPGNFDSIMYTYIPLYFFSNGTFAAPGFMYISESFPTRARGSATAFSMALIAASYAAGGFLFSAVLSATHNIHLTWLIIAVIIPFSSLIILAGKKINPNAELESIAY
ncbi:MFS transporter [Thermoplasma sp.]|uniref:MFS transporter n=1 Tax=Thermoplasma sp. TaxID=1973142 RepID=UPI00262DA0B2|nr:MFS transporter [Thermoplasma sp.]